MKGAFVYSMFLEEPVGTFAHGHIFINAPDIEEVRQDPRFGYWRCDIVHDNQLTWSEAVYSLFGLPAGVPVERDWAVARYTDASRAALEHARRYALDRKLGFILDAEIHPEGGEDRWIRVLAIPIVSARSGRVGALHGLKRAL